MKISLIGFMGVGKSTLGPLLAKRLGFEFIELDALVLKRSEMESIPAIFEKGGEGLFRTLETEVVAEFAAKDRIVIATGGGIVTNPANIEALRKNGIIAHLEASFETVAARLTAQQDRPLFQDMEKAKKLFNSRRTLYKNYADLALSTDGKSPEQLLQDLVDKLRNLVQKK